MILYRANTSALYLATQAPSGFLSLCCQSAEHLNPTLKHTYILYCLCITVHLHYLNVCPHTPPLQQVKLEVYGQSRRVMAMLRGSYFNPVSCHGDAVSFVDPFSVVYTLIDYATRLFGLCGCVRVCV